MSLGIYIHWPFCISKCPYCDFVSFPVRTAPDEAPWRAAYTKALDGFADHMAGRTVTSVYFGGGTPSLMSPMLVEAVLERISTLWPVADDAEITLEANPGAIDDAHMADLRRIGVGRLSLGIQALDDASLAALGRLHDTKTALTAYMNARKHFERVSFDLIYGRSSQTPKDWERELTLALALDPEHLSCYQLAIASGTPMADRSLDLPDEERAAQLFDMTTDMSNMAGLRPYEISNFARKGAQSRHNLTCWRYCPYLGIGPSAHGRLMTDGAVSALESDPDPVRWLADPAPRATLLSFEDIRIEMLLMGLRTAEGLARARVRSLLGVEMEAAYPAIWMLVESGDVTLDKTALTTTAQGRRRLDAVTAALV
ncbi:MAG: radical SAM family heme chaperone HemW [Pseudomonadota bacterium]|nr:radical SAM family heme chaperone HemW [Pseudomonadota bacterium]